jgi:glutaredoxin
LTIQVYSKPGCGICEAAKDKLDRMGFPYETRDLTQTIEPHEGWREDGSIELLAAYALIGNRVPILKIGAEYHDYPSAMRKLKTLRSERAGSDSEAVH